MKPEEYLEYLGRSSLGGRMALAPELRKAIGIYSKAIVKALYSQSGKDPDVSMLPDIWNPSYGPNAHFMTIRDEIIPFFKYTDRKKLKSVPIGEVYDLTPNGYAVSVPGGKGFVVCISCCLITMLELINRTIISVNEQERLTQIYAYAASKGMHIIDAYIHSKSGDVSFPFPPKTSLEALEKSIGATELQLYFIVAHELSHVVKNHILNNSGVSLEKKRVQELEADRCAAEVVCPLMKKKGITDNQIAAEIGLGAIGAIFYAGQAIFDFSTIDKSLQSSYPSPEQRFATVIDYFRSKLSFSNILGTDLFMRPYALISHIAHFMRKDPLESVAWLSEIANECRLMNDVPEEIYVLSLASVIACKAGNNKVADQIREYIDKTKQEHNIDFPIRGKD